MDTRTRFEIDAPWLDADEPFGLDSPASTGGGTVGDRIARTLAGRIHDRGISFRGPDGFWPMNAESTAKKKGFNAPNYETGLMLSEEKIRGEVASTHGEMSMEFGHGTPDYRGAQTDREVAARTDTGQSSRRITRPFFWLNESDCDAAAEIVADEWEAHQNG